MLWTRVSIAAVAALVVAGCARSSPPPIFNDPPRLGALEVEVLQEEGRVRFRAYRPLWGKWALGTPMPQPIVEARVERPGRGALWQVRTADPQAAVLVVTYPETPPGYARDVPASGPVPGLERGARYEVWLKDGRGWRRAEFLYAPEAGTP
jgi:hypothetical protein